MVDSVTVIDYGVGNLKSICQALAHFGVQPVLSESPDEILDAESVLLPGVGAFGDGMRGLEERNQADAIRQYAASGRPLLGICLGMQLLFDDSEEYGGHSGLGVLPGSIRAIPKTGPDGSSNPVPHVGWNDLYLPDNSEIEGGDNSILQDTGSGSSVYFVHSFAVANPDPKHLLAACDYNGNQITAVVAHDNIMGCQFHPEKSSFVGLDIIRNFLNFRPSSI